jgi:RimJ/RimL family protein N-acetyltransferase
MALAPAQPCAPLPATHDGAEAGTALSSGYVLDRAGLCTSRLVLRPLDPGDERAFICAVRATRRDLDEFCPLHRNAESDASLFERHLAMAAAAVATGKSVRLVVTPASHPARIIGAVNLNDITRGLEARGTANWWLVPGARRRGIAFEAVRALLEHGLGDLPLGRGVDRIDALIDPANFSSLRLAGRLGMTAQPGAYERIMIRGEAKVHQLFTAFADLPSLPASMIELKPIPGLDAIVRGELRL